MGKTTEKRGKTAGIEDRIKQLDNLLVAMDTPNEGDEIIYMIEGDDTRYRGKVVKRESSDKSAYYKIESNTKPVRKGKVVMIEYKGKKFKTGKKEI